MWGFSVDIRGWIIPHTLVLAVRCFLIQKKYIMKIGLIDIDNTGFPNLALMKISTYHKSMGDIVEFATIGNYDIVYCAKVFTFSPETIPGLISYQKIVKGGSGYSNTLKLPNEIEMCLPDYSIYNISDTAYGFITRGCPNACKWCIVPEKEGKVYPYQDIENLLQGKKKAIIMDNNILASDYGLSQIEKIITLKVKVDFNQGLDARLVTNDIAKMLSKVKWIRSIRFACDSDSMITPVINAMQLLVNHGVGKWRFDNYLLLNSDLKSAYNRANEMKRFGAGINAQPYRDFKELNKVPQWQKDFARWANRKWLYRSCDFKEFEPRKGFVCASYFLQ